MPTINSVQGNLTALVFGTSGLTGMLLVERLNKSSQFSNIIIFNRRSLNINEPKIKEVIIDFNDEQQLIDNMKGDVVFCCLGTTIKKAGSKELFRAIDYKLPVHIAELSFKNNIQKMLVLSSLGANSKSSNFYLKTKGEMEEAILSSGTPEVKIFRPSMLLGKRDEFRFGELIGKIFMQLFSFLFIGKLKKYKAIQASYVANAMCIVATGDFDETFFESQTIECIGRF